MNYRTKLLVIFAVTVAASVTIVAWSVSILTRRVFERVNAARNTALVAQFQREFARRGEEVTRDVEGIASAKDAQRIAVQTARSAPDYASLVNEAATLASEYRLDFLELLADDGTILSSAQWPARFGYKESWVAEKQDWASQGAFLKQEELPVSSALALIVVRPVSGAEKNLYVAGGKKVDSEFLASLTLPEGMRSLLYRDVPSGGNLTDAVGTIVPSERFLPLIAAVRRNPAVQAQRIIQTSGADTAETFHALPLLGLHQELLGMFLVGSSLAEQVLLERRIRSLAVIGGGLGIVLGMLLSAWAAVRVTRPIEQLAAAAHDVSQGRWDARVPVNSVNSVDEVDRLAQAFNHMTEQLTEQRDRLVQAERVAAWRELARRLAHELKNPLFPLQITVENLLRARATSEDQFEEVFRESTATLLAELANLRTIVGRFSDFAKMPPPQLQDVDLNAIVKSAVRTFDAQFAAPDQPRIIPQLDLAPLLGTIQADPDLLQRAVQNLILNAADAMPDGGTLTLRTTAGDDQVEFEVSDTGSGLTREECERLFTPYYTTKQYGTGLGLAIVQSVVSDHHGKISVESESGRGTTFRIVLPRRPQSCGTAGQTSPAVTRDILEAVVRS